MAMEMWKRGDTCDERREDTGERVAADYAKRKMVSSGEGGKVATAKVSRKGEPTYAEMYGRSVVNEKTDREGSEDSEGWSTVGRRRKERRGPQGLSFPGVRAVEVYVNRM